MWKLFTNFWKQVSVEHYELDRHHTHGDVNLARISYCFHGKFKHLCVMLFDGPNVWRILGAGACGEYFSCARKSVSPSCSMVPEQEPAKCLPSVFDTLLVGTWSCPDPKANKWVFSGSIFSLSPRSTQHLKCKTNLTKVLLLFSCQT